MEGRVVLVPLPGKSRFPGSKGLNFGIDIIYLLVKKVYQASVLFLEILALLYQSIQCIFCLFRI
jgi:hypothetical protein